MDVAIVTFDRFTDLDVFLAWDLLNRVRAPDWRVRLLGTEAQHRSRAGLAIAMHAPVEEAAGAEAVLFASGPATRTLCRDREWLGRFRLAPERQLIGAMCSGALLLAGLGLLDGRPATTYPTAREQLAAMGVRVVDEPFVRAGRVATAAACLAGVDLAGWVVEELLGAPARAAMLDEVRPVGRD
jgi:transcriptional regulator GlxA family with amidase domain